MSDRIQLSHPDPEKTQPTLDRTKFEAFRDALLTVIPADNDGNPFGDLNDAVLGVNPALPQLGSVGWYVTTVKLHLEAVGEIERVPNASPQRLRRKA